MPSDSQNTDNLPPLQEETISALEVLNILYLTPTLWTEERRNGVRKILEEYETKRSDDSVSGNPGRIEELMREYEEHGIDRLIEIITLDASPEPPKPKLFSLLSKASDKLTSRRKAGSKAKGAGKAKGASKKSSDSPLFKRKESRSSDSQIKAPEPSGDWAKAIALRIIIPIAIAGVISFFSSAEMPHARLGIFVPMVALTVWLVLHWYLVQWKNANILLVHQEKYRQNDWCFRRNEGRFPIVRAICRTHALLLLYAICVFIAYIAIGEQTGGTQAFDPVMILAGGWDLFVGTGLMQTDALFIAICIGYSFYAAWANGLEESEALWWLSAAVRIVRTFLYSFALMGALVALNMLNWTWTFVFQNDAVHSIAEAIEGAGAWLPATATMAGQFLGVGAGWIVLAILVVNTLWKRLHTWCKSEKEEIRSIGRTKKSDYPDFVPELLDKVGAVVRTIVVVILATLLFFKVFSLINIGDVQVDYFGAIWEALFESSIGLPAAFFLLITGTVLNCVTGPHSGKKHGALKSLGRFISYVMMFAAAGFAIYAVSMAQTETLIFTDLPGAMAASVERATPSMWSTYITGLWRFAWVIFVAFAVIVIAGIYISHDEANAPGGGQVYNGGVSGLAGGGVSFGGSSSGSGSSFGGSGSGGGSPWSSWGSSSNSNTQINDKYGRKVAEVDSSSLFGPTVVRDKHGAKVGTVRESSFGGPTRVSIGNNNYEVRDALFGGDKIVTQDGKEVGRIDSDGTFRKR